MQLMLRYGTESDCYFHYLRLMPTRLKREPKFVLLAFNQIERYSESWLIKLRRGERAGYGGGGVTALQAVIANVNRELTSLRKRQRKHSKAQAERRRQRTRSGAVTIGIVGYTNAGKSSFFLKMSGKEVLVEDKLFSTLETTVGRLAASPRVLLADTIGFIDNLPNATLDAFRATLSEALECDMLMVLVDATDSEDEFRRKDFRYSERNQLSLSWRGRC